VRQHGRIENMPDEIRQALGDQEAIDEVRRIFLHPDVTDAFDVQPAEPDLDGTSGSSATSASSRASASPPRSTARFASARSGNTLYGAQYVVSGFSRTSVPGVPLQPDLTGPPKGGRHVLSSICNPRAHRR
jgi:hypothetical protein